VFVAACSTPAHTDAGADADDVIDGAAGDGDAAADARDDASRVPPADHSSSIAIDPSGTRVFVANADADSVSIINVMTRTLEREIALATEPPRVDPLTQSFDPHVMPRTLAFAPASRVLYVANERSGEVAAIDTTSGAIVRRADAGSEPVGVLLSRDERTLYVACSNDDEIVRFDATTLTETGRLHTTFRKPWALARSADDATLYVSHLLAPGITPIDTSTFTARAPWMLPAIPRGTDDRLANGEVRGAYDLAVRPGTNEVWSAHLLLATHTPQPALKFDTTVFPGLSVFDASGSILARLSTDSQDVPGIDGAIADIVSGPHAMAFTSDGRYALVVDTNSEDVLIVDAMQRVAPSLLRPLPGHMPEGIVIAPDGLHAYLDERNTSDVAVLRIDRTATALRLAVDGPAITRVASDPMPSMLRDGQRVFYSANSDQLAITQNHWVACASCHLEGRSDAVTWQFRVGPRDTPSNAGGTGGTGFLLHTADRRSVLDYTRTIIEEQGGDPTDPSVADHMNALEAFVNHAIPPALPPRTDPVLRARGQDIFTRADVGCISCHRGTALTDSGLGNGTLDLSGSVVLHDVGTCNTGAYPDLAHTDDEGHPREACLFDTPSLRGLVDSAPYFHDGSAATLRDALEQTRGHMGDITMLRADELDALVEFLRSL
jgi:YVTN family beta-propeller protein